MLLLHVAFRGIHFLSNVLNSNYNSVKRTYRYYRLWYLSLYLNVYTRFLPINHTQTDAYVSSNIFMKNVLQVLFLFTEKLIHFTFLSCNAVKETKKSASSHKAMRYVVNFAP